MQVVAATAMEAPAGGDPQTLKDARWRSSGPSRRPTRRTTFAASTMATSRSTASRPDSTTETYAALRLDIENWRWSGVPFFIRTGKHLPVTQTEVRLVFKQPPRLGFVRHDRRSRPEPVVIRLDPATGVQVTLDAHRADMPRARADHARHGVRRRGRRGADPVRGAAPRRDGRADGSLHTPGRGRGGMADHAAAARSAPAVQPYAQGSWGPEAGDELVAGFGRWHGPWVEA